MVQVLEHFFLFVAYKTKEFIKNKITFEHEKFHVFDPNYFWIIITMIYLEYTNTYYFTSEQQTALYFIKRISLSGY